MIGLVGIVVGVGSLKTTALSMALVLQGTEVDSTHDALRVLDIILRQKAAKIDVLLLLLYILSFFFFFKCTLAVSSKFP